MNWDEIFIEADQLRYLVEQDAVYLFDCRFVLQEPQLGRLKWSEQRIETADYLHLEDDLSDEVSAGSGRHPLPTGSRLELLLRRLPADDKLLVCYDGGNQLFAARAWLIFRLQHKSCLILNGGLPAWLNCSSTRFHSVPTMRKIPLELIELEQFIDQPDFQPVDARQPERYSGQFEPLDPYPGHIAGAVNRPWQECFLPDGRFNGDLHWHRQRWQQSGPAKKNVHYCGSGITAAAGIISALLAECLPVYFYVGGWSEYYSRYPLLPSQQ